LEDSRTSSFDLASLRWICCWRWLWWYEYPLS